MPVALDEVPPTTYYEGMHKRKLHHIMVRLRPISYWYFVVLFIVSGTIALFALRQNNIRALELRDKVLEVDKQDGDVETALKELREYTYSHMNARLSSDTGIYPPVQLKYRYERLVEAEQRRVQVSDRDMYDKAQTHCEALYGAGALREQRVPCVQQYLDSNTQNSAQARPIPDSLYKFDFVAPVWSSDLAGWSLVVAGVALLLLVTRVAATLWLKQQLGD